MRRDSSANCGRRRRRKTRPLRRRSKRAPAISPRRSRKPRRGTRCFARSWSGFGSSQRNSQRRGLAVSACQAVGSRAFAEFTTSICRRLGTAWMLAIRRSSRVGRYGDAAMPGFPTASRMAYLLQMRRGVFSSSRTARARRRRARARGRASARDPCRATISGLRRAHAGSPALPRATRARDAGRRPPRRLR